MGNNPINSIDPHGLDCVADEKTRTTTCKVPVTGSRIPQRITFPTPKGVTGTYRSNDVLRRHVYDYRTPHGKSDESVQQSIVSDPTPSNADEPAKPMPEGTENPAAPEGGRGVLSSAGGVVFGDDAWAPVKSYSFIDEHGNTWVMNVTQEGHGLHFGYVLRDSVGGEAITIGEGWAMPQRTPLLRTFINNVWRSQNQANIDNAR